MQVPITIISPDGREKILWAFKGQNLWEVMALNGMEPGQNCGGRGTCGKCKVGLEGYSLPLYHNEKEHLLAEEINTGERLACYCTVVEPLKVYLHYSDYNDKHLKEILLDKSLTGKNHRVYNQRFFIPGLDRQNPVPLYQRLSESLAGYVFQLSSGCLNELAHLDRAGRPSLELWATIIDNKIVKNISRERKTPLGIALDIGSTTLFAALIDMAGGEIIAQSSAANMQKVFGADIISRVTYCLENKDGGEKLHQILINNINSLIGDLLQECGLNQEQIYELVAVGNPVMLHFLLNLDTRGFAQAPYSGIFYDEISCSASSQGILANCNAELVLLPQIGGFVGADTIACLLTVPYDKKSYLLIDIGTNGEIVLSDGRRLWAASTAAGPAFEAGGITCGVRAGEGAIDRVYWDEQGKFDFRLLGEGPVKGLCGSAIIDILAGLLNNGYISSNGVITNKTHSNFITRQSNRGTQIILMAEENTLSGLPLVLDQEDIRQIQLAKSAIRTGIDILLEKAGMSFDQLDRIYLAGAFGSFVDPRNAIRVGILPPVEHQKVVNIGNAAGLGTVKALLQLEQRENARKIKKKIEYVELAGQETFQKKYIQYLDF
jgi:uncharacterized 2Fe-2S/4Fe-4S cluster protein (DUF4445 family)